MPATAASVGRARAGLAVILLLTMAGCGSSSHKKATAGAVAGTSGGAAKTVALSISESGTSAKYTVPASAQGGLVNFELTNKGKVPHSAHLGRGADVHTIMQAL